MGRLAKLVCETLAKRIWGTGPLVASDGHCRSSGTWSRFGLIWRVNEAFVFDISRDMICTRGRQHGRLRDVVAASFEPLHGEHSRALDACHHVIKQLYPFCFPA